MEGDLINDDSLCDPIEKSALRAIYGRVEAHFIHGIRPNRCVCSVLFATVTHRRYANGAFVAHTSKIFLTLISKKRLYF